MPKWYRRWLTAMNPDFIQLAPNGAQIKIYFQNSAKFFRNLKKIAKNFLGGLEMNSKQTKIMEIHLQNTDCKMQARL